MGKPLTIAVALGSVPFTPDVLAGTVALGGSESSTIGLARALVTRGHRVHIFAQQLDPACIGADQGGVTWRPIDALPRWAEAEEPDVFIAVRAFQLFMGGRVPAALRVLWTHDLLVPDLVPHVMTAARQVDAVAYVSAYHRQQWEGLAPQLAPLGWTTTNGFDPSIVPSGTVRDLRRLIYCSRPERGLAPLLAMWPSLRAAEPDVTLALCRYGSWDAASAAYCAQMDAEVARLQETVGGIEWLGELAKPALYHELARATALWYPGVADFAETSCIAAIEAQACGALVIASRKGALPETAAPADGIGDLLEGDASTAEYQAEAVARVRYRLAQATAQTPDYRALQAAGRRHAATYAFDRVAAQWDAQIEAWFAARAQPTIRIVRQLVREDDFVAAAALATTVVRDTHASEQDQHEAARVLEQAEDVIRGRECTPEHYGQFAMDALEEARLSARHRVTAQLLVDAGVRRVLDVACGNGACALVLAQAHPDVEVVGLDVSAQNIARARAAAVALGLQDRVTFHELSVIDLATQRPTEAWYGFAARQPLFDGLVVGEFLEHVAEATGLLEELQLAVAHRGCVVVTVPHGPWGELAPRTVERHQGHVHRFSASDLDAIFGAQLGYVRQYLPAGHTPRGSFVGNWIVRYTAAVDGPRLGHRDLATRLRRTRPFQRLSVAIIAHNAAQDLARCLESVWSIADEIVVGDTGSTDETAAIARQFGATVLALPTVEAFDDGFAGARNAVLDAASGEWILSIDADEQLIGGHELRKYLESGPQHQLVFAQRHLTLDLALPPDPQPRVFRRLPAYRWYGCIHEQPGHGDANTEIQPSLGVEEVSLAHFGYLVEDQRRAKSLRRNAPLLRRDRVRNPTRRLGAALLLRDEVTLAELAREAAGGRITPEAADGYRRALALWDATCADPRDRLHQIVRPVYELALARLGEGFEVEWVLVGAPARRGGLEGVTTRPARIRVRTADELWRLIEHDFAEVRAKMTPPVLDTAPVVPTRVRGAA